MELKCFEYVDIKRLSPVKCIVKLYLRVEIKTEQSYQCWFILHVWLALLILVAKWLNLERKIVKITWQKLMQKLACLQKTLHL